MKRLIVSATFALSLVLTAPASAQFAPVVVIDPKAIAQALDTYHQIQQEIAIAKQMAADIPGTFRGTNIPGQLQAVTGMITQAQSACPNMNTTVRALPAACAVKINVANAQMQQMNGTMAQLESLQNLARGSTGTLQAEKANALALIQLATQNASQQAAQHASVVDQYIKDQQTLNTRKPSTVNPSAP
jgi:hypothetical protein